MDGFSLSYVKKKLPCVTCLIGHPYLEKEVREIIPPLILTGKVGIRGLKQCVITDRQQAEPTG
jgi:hypothetical protein